MAQLEHAYMHMLPTPCSPSLDKADIRRIVRPAPLLWGSRWDQRLRQQELATHLGTPPGSRWPGLLFTPTCQILATSKRVERQLIQRMLPGEGWVAKFYHHAESGMCRGGVGVQVCEQHVEITVCAFHYVRSLFFMPHFIVCTAETLEQMVAFGTSGNS